MLPLVEHLTNRWRLQDLNPLFCAFMIVGIVLYFGLRPFGRTALEEATIGLIVGLLSGSVAVLISAYLQFGASGLERGMEAGGVSYLGLVIGASVFPFFG